MPDINGTLNVVIGFLTVVLVLSLIVQSLQNLIKKLLRMKSRHAEQSLKMLFDYALTADQTKYTEMKYASPILGALARAVGAGKEAIKGRSKSAKDDGKDGSNFGVGDALVEAVKVEVREMGRKSFWGTALLETITKDDLDKILKNIDLDKLSKEAKAAINGKVGDVERWYDTVMPGLAERYERGMKWMAVLLSAIVVVLLNADAISIYTSVASDPVVQQRLLEYAQTHINEKKTSETQESKPKQEAPPKPNPANSNASANSNAAGGASSAQNANTAGNPDSTANSNAAANSNASPNSNTAPNPEPAANSNRVANSNVAANSNRPATANRTANSNTGANPEASTKTDAEAKAAADAKARKELEDAITNTQNLYAQYQQFGFKPFSLESLKNEDTRWRTVLGWLVMTLLVSMGAPFWEDALESVFSLKNTLRGKSKTEEKKAQQPG